MKNGALGGAVEVLFAEYGVGVEKASAPASRSVTGVCGGGMEFGVVAAFSSFFFGVC